MRHRLNSRQNINICYMLASSSHRYQMLDRTKLIGKKCKAIVWWKMAILISKILIIIIIARAKKTTLLSYAYHHSAERWIPNLDFFLWHITLSSLDSKHTHTHPNSFLCINVACVKIVNKQKKSYKVKIGKQKKKFEILFIFYNLWTWCCHLVMLICIQKNF